jgi:hypothetical protein
MASSEATSRTFFTHIGTFAVSLAFFLMAESGRISSSK